MYDSELIEIIEVGERAVFEAAKNDKDGKDILSRLIKLEAERLENAAEMIGRQWHGFFSNAHVKVIVRAYNEANRRTVQRASIAAREGGK
jgi:hypothetical protein